MNYGALSTVASIFLLLLVGYGAKRLRILSAKDTGVIDSIVINLALPAFIFSSMHDKPLTVGMIKAPFVGLSMEIAVLGAAYLIARKLRLDRPTTAGLMIAAAFGNTGYMGLPVVSAVFHGDKAAIQSAVMMDSFAMRILLCTAGVAVATFFAGERFSWQSALEFLKSPLSAAVVIALLLRTTHVPGLLMSSITYMGNAIVPLSMISVGLNLSTGSVRRWPLGIAAAVVLKMALLPALVYLCLPLLHIEHAVGRVAVLEMAMPSAIFGGVIAGRYGANKEFVAGAIFASTLASTLVLPAVLMLVG